MHFFIPVKIYENTLEIFEHANEFKKIGSKGLVITGKSSAKKCGALDDLLKVFQETNIESVIYDKIEENPSVETIIDAVSLNEDRNIDFVVGIGGGSPMDAAKAIAFLLNHKEAVTAEEKAELLYDTSKGSDTLPIVLIPTTCGTGSEATGVSVLTRHDKKAKGSIPHRIYADFSICDPRYIEKLPDPVLHSSAIDALCHAVESYINVKASDYSKMFALEAIRILGKELPLLAEKDRVELTIENYQKLLHASTLAGMAIAHTGTSLPHALSYRLTYNDGIAHGTACAYFLSAYVKMSPKMEQKAVLEAMNLSSCEELESLVNKVCDFSQIDKMTCAISVEEIDKNPAKKATAPFEVDMKKFC